MADYYRPYHDEEAEFQEKEDVADVEETDIEDDAETDDDETNAIFDAMNRPDFRAFAQAIRYMTAAGPAFPNADQRIRYGRNKIGRRTAYSAIDEAFTESDTVKALPEYGKTTAVVREVDANPILINSRDRFRPLYAQPTFFSTRLPQSYRNITSINFAQMSFLNRLYYFRSSKNNIRLPLQEYDRPTMTIPIDQGSYNIGSLRSAIQSNLNHIPLFYDFATEDFYDYQGAYNAFANQFNLSRDFSINFNFQTNAAATYWSGTSSNLGDPLSQEKIYLAYYYPVLKKILTDDSYQGDTIDLSVGLPAGLESSPPILDTTDVYNRCVNGFKGLNPVDPVVYAVASHPPNRTILDVYRLQNTFRFSLINAYTIGINSQDSTTSITAYSLNTSLSNLLTQRRGEYQTNFLSNNNITAAEYSNLKNKISKLDYILTDMYNYTQLTYADCFAVPYNTYSRNYYGTPSNSVKLRNGLAAYNIPRTPADATAASISTIYTDILTPLQKNPTTRWPYMSNLDASTISMENLSNASRGDINHPYSVDLGTIDEKEQVIDISSGTYYFKLNSISKKVDCIIPISAGTYTTFKFHSPVRQTLQVETLPRPLEYRYPSYNQEKYSPLINKYFKSNYSYDVSANNYTPNDPSIYSYAYDNLPISFLKTIPSWSNNNTDRWLTDYNTSKTFYESAELLQATSTGTNPPWNGLFYSFQTPDVSGADPSKAYRYPLNLTAEIYTDSTGSTLTTAPGTFRIFLYADRAAFQADLYMRTRAGGFVAEFTNFRSEDPVNYKYSAAITSADTSGTIHFHAYPGQTYYVSCRADNATAGSIYTKIFPWFSADTSSNIIAMDRTIGNMNPATDNIDASSTVLSNYNYAAAYDYDALVLPNTSTLWGGDPDLTAASFDVDVSATPIGFDISGISNDFLDYIPYNSYVSTFAFETNSNKAIIGFDPIRRYLFESNSPYNADSGSYFYTGSENSIYTPAAAFGYTPKRVLKRQDKIVHYYSPTYIPEPAYAIESGLYPNIRSLVADGPAQQPYTSTSTGGPIPGFQYDSSGTLNLNFGTTGFTFAPKSGLWSIDTIQLRSALYTSNATSDPNSQVKYLGIFQTADINDIQYVKWTMSTAVAVLSNSARVGYAPRTSNFDITFRGDIQDSGFDTRGGTYYEYKYDPSFIPPLRSSTIQGYTQIEDSITNNPANLYSVICLDSNYQPIPFKAMSGSVVPYPFYNQISTGYTYMNTDIESPQNDARRGLVYPSTPITDLRQTEWKFLNLTDISNGVHGPTVPGIVSSQSAYGHSMPIGTSVLHTQRQNNPFIDICGVYHWSTPVQPGEAYMRCAGTVLFQAGDYYLYKFDPNNTSYRITTDDLLFTVPSSTIFDTITTGITLVAAAASTTEYFFMGWRSTTNGTTVYFKRFDPTTYSISTYLTPLEIPNPAPIFNSFTINNTGDILFSIHDPTTDKSIFYRYTNTWTTSAPSTAGKRWIHDQDPSGGSYFYSLEVDSASGKGSLLHMYRTSFTDMSGYTLTHGGPTSYSGIMVNDLRTQRFEDPVLVIDDIIFYTTEEGYTDYIYGVYSSTEDTMSVKRIATQFTGTRVMSVAGGYSGAFWALTDAPSPLWGNRNNALDLKYRIDSEWQVFYPYQKISLVQNGVSENPILDTKKLLPGEYLHTNLFYYPTENAYKADISGRWGLENSSNFYVGDVDYRGYLFNSYIFDIPLQRSSGSDYQYITVRGYSPTESGECMVRFSCTNLYDFGYASFVDVSNEIQLYRTTPSMFDPDYAACIENFDNQYKITSNRAWGKAMSINFTGSNYSTSNYGAFISTYANLSYEYNSTSKIINAIDDGVSQQLSTFIGTDLRYILPASAALRQNYTDPVFFRIPWETSLPDAFRQLKDNWGLGYNLGFNKVDTPYRLTHRGQNGYRILDDYIYLQLNAEENMNRLDILGENTDQNSIGQKNKYFGKLLLNNYGSLCTTMIQNSVKFNPPLARLDKMSFQWVDEGGTLIDSADSEWTAALTITERRTVQMQNVNGAV
jgi:hypothetical protein